MNVLNSKIKISDYLFLPGVRTLAVIFGLFAGIAALLIFNWEIAVLVGAGVALLTSFIVPILLYRADLPYERIKKTLKHPFLFDERVRFSVRGGSMGGFFILTEESMVFLSLERGSQRLELNREDVKSIVLDEQFYMNIFLNNTQFIRVASGTCEEMYRILCENGWTRC